MGGVRRVRKLFKRVLMPFSPKNVSKISITKIKRHETTKLP